MLMETIQKVIELLSKKYKARISILSNNLDGRFNSMLDTKNGTMFSVSFDSLYVFKDSNNNFWSTTPRSFVYNDKKYYPKAGQEYTRHDGIKYTFTTREEVLEKAMAYFEKFIDPNYGIKIVNQKLFFYEGRDKTEVLNLQKFKSRLFGKIDTYISFN
ncbi:hypothetical protein HYN56_21145 [Flavobacterium crocinum]|uniref:Uncharacterized protein n=2 Tax=Flavobacterium crocinum TaxID=2183896 RepID=A0A2S1YRA0_9FLAO|nr:hypothetical protein HYN56_21145 [Flavobacterium crocinum]